jgi:hypothetical protein
MREGVGVLSAPGFEEASFLSAFLFAAGLGFFFFSATVRTIFSR